MVVKSFRDKYSFEQVNQCTVGGLPEVLDVELLARLAGCRC